MLVSLEQYYRSEIPREKLFDQIQSGAYVSDPELWRAWRDQHDSAQVSYVGIHADAGFGGRKGDLATADLRAVLRSAQGRIPGHRPREPDGRR